jgi:hypothetical protein
MNRMLLKLAMTVMVGGVLHTTSAATQESGPARKGAGVRIIGEPSLERVDPGFAIVRWTSETPGGSPAHVGIVRYGMEPTNLSQTANSPIRLNPDHSYTVFRVRMDGLKPRTTYYFTVESTDANGKSDGVKSKVKHFTTS